MRGMLAIALSSKEYKLNLRGLSIEQFPLSRTGNWPRELSWQKRAKTFAFKY